MSDEAFIHARWHRALDDPNSEPRGPIRDHIEQALAAAWDAGFTSCIGPPCLNLDDPDAHTRNPYRADSTGGRE